jgi:CRISPR-associated protein Csm1
MNIFAVNAHAPPNDKGYVRLPSNLSLIQVNPLTNEDCKFEMELGAELASSKAPVMKVYRPFAQLVPTNDKNQPLTFDELANQTTGGLKHWGVLRMDVDNLGKLFEIGFVQVQNGEQENKLTISRVASLSFALRLFFEGWLPKLGQTDETLHNRLYVQYAGGDDLFVVGSWDALPEFAHLIQESFSKYVSRHPQITLSGGVSLATEKYPLYQAAREAGSAEHAAKQWIRSEKRDDGGPVKKDAFCFLGQVVGWEEFGPVKARAHQLQKWCNEGKIPNAVLQTLLSIHTEYAEGCARALSEGLWQPGQIYFGPWMWHLAYQLARRVQDKKTPADVAKELKLLEQEMLESQDKIETIGLAARWAQYLVRQ